MRTHLAIAAGAAGICVILFALFFGRVDHPKLPAPVIPSGTEEAIPGGVFVSGFNLPSQAPCNFAEVYAGASTLLNVPLSSFTGRSMDFEFGRLLCSPADGSKPVVYANLGEEYLRKQGYFPQPDQSLHPLLADYLRDAKASGLDPAFFGRVLSKPMCRDGLCIQYMDRMAFELDTRTKTVRWLPLGCYLNDRCAQAQQTISLPQHAGFFAPLLLLGALLLLAGAGLLVLQRPASGIRRGFDLA